ncbi:phospholipid-transporting ATPase ABCA3-like [Physella acuta]|uniref:phospholipid-transporting ATPase ABCA3-like n=1 Tax=Physella acuta TaxID=109671 RepID=UPI0027DB5624|nr:phospholipid-transporting ATPase ABCA3-like [Physella acuta]
MFEKAESSADKVPAKLDFKVVLFEPVPAFKTFNLSFDYTEAGLTSAQLLVTKMFLNYWKQEKQLVFSSNVSVKTRRLPDKVMDVYETYLIYLPAIFIVFTVMSTVVIVEEKTSSIQDALKNAGVSQTVYWISWILYRMIVGLLSSGVAIVYWLRKMDTGYTQYVSKTKFVIWILLTVLNNLTFASVLACLLPSRLVVTSTTVFYGLLNALSYALTSAKVTSIKILAGLLLFSHGNRICVDAVFSKEILYGNLKDSDRLDNQFIEGAMYMFFNSVINAVVVLAVEVICNIKKKHIKRTNVGPVPPVQNDKCFETATGEDAFGIVIRDLVKVYGEDTVVSGINLDIYKDQITMLLGHNGAGKTTTLSIISGVTSITKGKVTINGSDVSSRGIRRTVGYCSDVDTLFPNLTSFEHLVFYSKTVILDEPSTGLDPASRQDMWRALKSWRQGRTIFMTTHFMDEAENLGDRIAIMEKGRIKCCGTPMFLKNIFGLEHKLTIVKGDNCNGHKVVKHVTSCIREAIFQTSNATDLIFSLPGSSGSEIPRLLSSLENEMESLHITSYRLAPTSMQDVFTRSLQEDFVNE